MSTLSITSGQGWAVKSSPFSGNAGLTAVKSAHELSRPVPETRPDLVAIFEFQNLKRVQAGNPLCHHEMGFISLRIRKKQRLGVTRTWSIRHIIFLSDIRATELKPAGCRSYAMLRPSGIQNENITRMNLGFNPDPVYVGKLQVNASQWRTQRHGEDSIWWWKTNEEVTFLNVSNGCPFSLLQGNAQIHQTKSLGSLSNDDVDVNEIGEKKQ